MAFVNPAQINISLATRSVNQKGFGVPLFIDANFWGTERAKVFTSADAAKAELPDGSPALTGVLAAFANEVKPERVILGRRQADSLLLVPDTVTTSGQTYEIVVEDTDGDTITASFVTSTGTETASDIVTDILADLGSATGVTTSGTTDITLSKTGTDDFAITSVKGFTYTATATESASLALTEVLKANRDAYFVASSDHSEAFILAMTDATASEEMIYFWSTQQENDLDAWNGTDAPTTISEKVADKNALRSVGMFDDEADTKFPEMTYIGRFATKTPGTTTWTYKSLNGISAARNPTTGNLLTDTELNNICENKNLNVVVDLKGVDVVRDGKTTSGEWIDVVRSRDFLAARLREAICNMLINKDKIPYTNSGISTVYGVIRTVLNRYVTTENQPNILSDDNPYELNVVRSEDISFADKAERKLSISGTAFLAGAIQLVELNLNLTYDAAA